MIMLILKSSACLAVFMVFYKLFLEKESMHHFKRFYLLGALVVSIIIPFITFTQYIEVAPVENLVTFSPSELTTTQGFTPETKVAWQDYIPSILWSIYLMGAILFSFRFAINLKTIVHRIKTNPKHQYHAFTNVLLQDLIHPHTFLKYIFLNKTKYENNLIPTEVLLHEQTHAKQKHALDILCIEVLQIIFWFNPLLYFIKKDIKLNHEFLADQAVLQKGIDSAQYKQTLLTFSSNAIEPQLTNAINYSLIKKRFNVMKTQTSKTAIWLRSFVLLPLLAITLYSFSDTKVVEKIFEEISGINHTARSIDIEVFENGTYEIDGIKATKKTFISVINQLHQDISPEIRNRSINVHVNNGKVVLDEEVWFIYNSVIDYGFHRIVTYNQEIIREKGNKPFTITNTDTQEQSNAIFKKSEQQKASKEQIAEYNKLSKHYNSQPIDKRIYKQRDIERLKYLYELMSAAQKKNVEPFPNIAPPPPPPAPKAKKADVPPPPLPPNATDAQKKKYKEAIRDAQVAAKIQRVKAEKQKMVRVREIRSADERKKLKQEKLAYKETQVAARTLKLKAQKERVKVREIRTVEDRNKLKHEKLAYKEAQVAARTLKLKAQKRELVKIREVRSAVDRKKLKQEKLAYREAQVAARVQKAKAGKERRIKVREIMPPPPPLPKNATSEQKRKYEAAIKAYKLNQARRVKERKTGNIKDVPPPPPIPENVPVEERERMIEVTEAYHNEVENINEVEIAEVPEIEEVEVEAIENLFEVEEAAIEEVELEEINEVPPPPVSPLDHVKQMAAKGAKFIYNGKSISSEKAMKIMRSNKKMSVMTNHTDDSDYVVTLSTKPIIVSN